MTYMFDILQSVEVQSRMMEAELIKFGSLVCFGMQLVEEVELGGQRHYI